MKCLENAVQENVFLSKNARRFLGAEVGEVMATRDA
jgi:hypothetical protein